MNQTRLWLARVTALAFASSVAAAPQGPAPGFRMYGPHGSTDTHLVDTAGKIVHTWPGTYTPGNGMYLDADGTLVRSGTATGAPAIGGSGGNVQRIAFDGTVQWDFDYANNAVWGHHDIEIMPNGNVMFIAWDRMSAADAIAAGRDPALLGGPNWWPDHIAEVQQTGPTTGIVVWEWHLADHLVQDFDATKANFGVVADHPELLDINYPPNVVSNGDYNHCNSIDYDPGSDLVLLNSPFQSEFYLIDHSTTTFEAAGHTGGARGKGGDFVYRWGNPQSYQRGTASNQMLFFPHGTNFIPPGLPGAGNILCFNNQAGTPMAMNYSTVVEFQLPPTFALPAGQAWGPTGFVWEYRDPVPTNLFSRGLSNAERLPNGNTLVVSGRQNGWMFELTPGKQKVWEYFNTQPTPSALVFQVSYYERYLWADKQQLSARAGGTVNFDMVAGSAHAGEAYLLLGSASGTTPGIAYSGFNLPLNFDFYFNFTAVAAGGPILPTFFGTLDSLGNAAASLTFPRIPAVAGMELHHAYAVIDPMTFALTFTSNAVPLQFVH